MSEDHQPLVLHGPWVILLLELAMVWVLARAGWWAFKAVRDPEQRADVRIVTALAVVAWVVRFAAPSQMHDINLRVLLPGPSAGQFMSYYGLATLAWTTMWSRVFPATHAMLFEVGAVTSAFTVPALWAVLRDLGLSRRTTLWSVALFLLHPGFVWFGHTDMQMVPSVFLWLLGLHGLSRWMRTGSGIDALTASAAIALASQFRPAAPLLALVAGAWLASRWRDLPRDRWLMLGPALALLIVTPHLANMGVRAIIPQHDAEASVSHLLQSVTVADGGLPGVFAYGPEHLPMLDDVYTSRLTSAVILFGLFAGDASLKLRVGLGLAWFLLSFNGGVWSAKDGAYMVVRLQWMSMVMSIPLFGIGMTTLLDMVGPRWRVLVGAAGVAALAQRTAHAFARPGEVVEWDFLEETLPTVPDGCFIYRVHGNRTLAPPEFLSPEVGREHTWLRLAENEVKVGLPTITPGSEDDPGRDADCRLYYRPGECFTRREGTVLIRRTLAEAQAQTEMAELSPTCAEVEAGLEITPLVTTEIPNFTYIYSTYAPGRMVVGWYRLEGP